MPCQAGPDYSVENMQEMIGEWRSLLTADELRGAWGYALLQNQMHLVTQAGGS